jgi:hypothetical protein
MKKLHAALAALAATAALGAAAQVVRPTIDYTDLWYVPGEEGWGISIRQKVPVGGNENTVDALFSVWYTYDPRAVDPASPGGTGNVPLWIVMPGGSWITPTRWTGDMYVLYATPYTEPWSTAQRRMTKIGTYRYDFTEPHRATFTYAIDPPAGVPATDPAFGLPAQSGTKRIERLPF